MQIKTLENTSLADLTAAFNEAFSDYIIPFQWTEEIAARKFKGDNIDLSLSPGFFVDGKLCGFIFHCIGKREGKPIVWNGGTGVVPTQRGKGLTTQLYNYIIPMLRNKGFDRTVLEVIEGNDPAIHVYKKNGFEQTRKLDCYKGELTDENGPDDLDFKMIDQIDWSVLETCRSWEPTFQNSNQKINILRDSMRVIGAFEKDKLLGYIIFDENSKDGNIFQFAVKESQRKRGIGKSLFAKAADGKSVPLKIINVDAGDQSSHDFFIKNGFQKTVSQFEMLKIL